MYSLMIISLYVVLAMAFLMRTEWFKRCCGNLWNQWKNLHFGVKAFSLIFIAYMTVFATVKPTVPAVPEGLESTPELVEASISGSAATASTSSKDSLSMLSDNGYSRLSETGDSFISKVVTNTALTWLVMPEDAIVYSGWTNYGVAEDTFWVNATNPASSWGFVYGTNLVEGAHVSSSRTLSFDVSKGSPTPHEMAG